MLLSIRAEYAVFEVKMKVRLIGKNLSDIEGLLKDYDMQIITSGEPELVIAHGGDGTMLNSEREFPGIPKLLMRDCRTAPQCEEHGYKDILESFAGGRLKLTELPKLVVTIRDTELYAINDIFVHNYERMNALRYRVYINDELYAKEVVGDAVGISSVHGSTAYYKSITHSIFRTGIGLSFSNSTEEVNHLVLPETSVVRVSIIRGPGLIISDNDRRTLLADEGEDIFLKQSSEKFGYFYGLQEFMCPKCRILRHPNKSPYQGYIAP